MHIRQLDNPEYMRRGVRAREAKAFFCKRHVLFKYGIFYYFSTMILASTDQTLVTAKETEPLSSQRLTAVRSGDNSENSNFATTTKASTTSGSKTIIRNYKYRCNSLSENTGQIPPPPPPLDLKILT